MLVGAPPHVLREYDDCLALGTVVASQATSHRKRRVQCVVSFEHGLPRNERMAHLEIKLKALYEMSAQEREKTLSELVKGANSPRNGHPSRLDTRIREFEVRFEMTSAELHERLRAGVLEETAEIAKWLFLLDARGEKQVFRSRRNEMHCHA